MIGRIFAIGLNTFREAVRHRVLWGILVVAMGLILFSVVLGEMSYHEEARVARDVGLGGASFFGSITAIVLGVSLLYSEIQRRTIHTIIAKPIERFEFVLGKYVGMACTLALLVCLFGVLMMITLRVQQVPFTPALLKALVLAGFEVLVVAALAVFFSSFSSPFLSGIFAFAVFLLGRVTPELRAAVATAKSEFIRVVCNVALKLVPDLHLFGISGSTLDDGSHVSIHLGEFVPWSYVGAASLHALLFIGLLLSLAILIFSRRDFV